MKTLSKLFDNRTSRKLHQLILLLSLALPTDFVLASSGNTTNVYCTNSSTTDRTLIQTAINNATSGDTIIINGTCQLDGTRVFITKSNLTLTGSGLITDATHTLIKGVVNGAGIPFNDVGAVSAHSLPPWTLYNRGFQIGDATGNSQVQNVTIQNIEFANFNRAIAVVPQFGQPTTSLCNNLNIGTGTASAIKIQNNMFDNNRRGVQIIGNASNITIQNNMSSGNFAVVYYYQGGSSTCTTFSLNDTFKLVGLIKSSAMLGNNDNDTKGANALAATGTDSLNIANNILTSTGNGFAIIFPSNNSKMKIASNQIIGSGVFGVYLSDATEESKPFNGGDVYTVPSSQVSVNNNLISNNVFGVFIDTGTTGTSTINNIFSGNAATDIYLCDGVDAGMTGACFAIPSFVFTPSHDNTVVTTNFSNTVVNLGINNKLLGTQNLLNNPVVSDAVKAKLSVGAKGRPLE